MTTQTELMLPQPKKKKNAEPFYGGVIFDIDNVLVDTRRSYLDAIRWTIDIFLTEGKVPFFSAKKSKKNHLLSPGDVAQFKLLGGFNDDWDCCYGILTYLLSLPVKGRTIQELKRKINIPQFIKTVKTRPLGVNGIVKKLGRHTYVTIEKISRIFQEVYLGKDLFEKLTHHAALYWIKLGLIRKEKLAFRRSTLSKLKSLGVKLGITTGRPRFEATYALRHFGIHEMFDAVTTMDDVRKAEAEMKQSLRKPHPFSLIETAKKLGTKKPLLYVGDLPDDILTAVRAKEFLDIHSVGFPALSSTLQETLLEMKRLKVDFLIQKPSELPAIVLKGKPPQAG